MIDKYKCINLASAAVNLRKRERDKKKNNEMIDL